MRIGDVGLLPPELKKVHCIDVRKERPKWRGKALTELVRILETPAPLGNLVMVPELVPHFLPRTINLDAAKGDLLADVQKPIIISGTVRKAGLQGMGGIGKSVLAAAIAHDCEIRRAFPGSIIWITFGQEPSLLLLQANLGRILGDTSATFPNTTVGKAKLKDLLKDKIVLLILDDIWNIEHVEAFDVLGPRCRMLITTRNRELITALGASDYRLDVFDDEQAVELLALWSGKKTEELTPDVYKVAHQCGNLPLALALSGALVRDGTNWHDLLDALRAADLSFLDHPHGSVMKSLKVSIDALETEDSIIARRYLELAVFPADASIPEKAILTLWSYTGNIDERTGRRLLTKLVNRALLRITDDSYEHSYELHDLLYAYLVSMVGNHMNTLHKKLLIAYQRTCPKGWHTGPNDGYFFDHTIYHLVHAECQIEAQQLLHSFAWMQARLSATSIDRLIADYGLVSALESLQLIQNALLSSQHVLAKHKTQLASQLTGRLLPVEDETISILLSDIVQLQTGFWLRPLNSALISSALTRVLVGHIPDNDKPRFSRVPTYMKSYYKSPEYSIKAIALFPDKSQLISASADHTLKIWDLRNGNILFTLYGHQDRVNAVVVTPDSKYAISGSDDQTLMVWNLVNGELEATLRGHMKPITAITITPDGRYCISASKDSTIKIWDLALKTEVRTLTGHRDWVTALTMLPNRNLIVSGANYGENKLRIWDWRQGELLKAYDTPSISALSTTPHGHLLIFATHELTSSRVHYKDTLELLELDGMEARHTLDMYSGDYNPIHSLVALDDEHIICSAADGFLRLWNLVSRCELNRIKIHGESVNDIISIPDKEILISASDDGLIRIWKLGDLLKFHKQQGHTQVVLDIVVSSDSRWAITVSEDKTVKIWDTQNCTVYASFESFDDNDKEYYSIMDAQINSNGKIVTMYCVDNDYHTNPQEIFEVAVSGLEERGRSNIEVIFKKSFVGHQHSVSQIPKKERKLAANDRFLAKIQDNVLQIFDKKEMALLAEYTSDALLEVVTLTPDGVIVLVGDVSGEIHFLRLEHE